MEDIESQEKHFYRRALVMSSISAFIAITAKVLSLFRHELLGITRGYAPYNAALNISLLFAHFVALVISFVVLLEIFINWKTLTEKPKVIIPICLATAIFTISGYTVLKFILQ